MLNDLKFNSFNKSTSRSNFDKKKSRALINFTLSSIHTLKVLKAVKRKVLRR